MKVTGQIVIDAQDGTPPATEQVAVIARDDLTMASAGLALAEAHEVLSGIQHHLVTAQAVTAAVAAVTAVAPAAAAAETRCYSAPGDSFLTGTPDASQTCQPQISGDPAAG